MQVADIVVTCKCVSAGFVVLGYGCCDYGFRLWVSGKGVG